MPPPLFPPRISRLFGIAMEGGGDGNQAMEGGGDGNQAMEGDGNRGGGDGNRAMEGGGDGAGLLDFESLSFGPTVATRETSTITRAALIQESPVVSLRNVEQPSHYTVILTSKKDTEKEYIHWLVTDIPWSTNPEVSQGTVKLEYEPPNNNGPPLHFFLRLYGQKRGTTPSVPQRRRDFQPHNFLQQNDLQKVVSDLREVGNKVGKPIQFDIDIAM